MAPGLIPRTHPATRPCAAQYIRMSTDHQEYSPLFQREAIAKFAAAHGIRIVRDYEDAGISGLTLRERPALIRLLLDVESPTRRFDSVLVYDVSRWGRFQDVDEGAFYEYACRRAGVQVIYVAETFENDGSQTASVMKTLKRAMAGEFSRELSRKVFLGHCLNVQRGYHAGGPPGIGLQRILVARNDGQMRHLHRHEYKSVHSDRVALAPGPPNEVALIRTIFDWYLSRSISAAAIARRLNDFGIVNGVGRTWQGANILNILRNEKYIGTNVYSRTTSKLDCHWEQLPKEEWIQIRNAFEPVVDRSVFVAVQQKMARTGHKLTRDEIVEGLRKLVRKTGTLNQSLLRRYRSAPSVEQVMREFGSLYEAYKAIGYHPRLTQERSENRCAEGVAERRVIDVVLEKLRKTGHRVQFEKHTMTLCIDEALRLQLVIRSPWLIQGHLPYWVVRWPDCFAIDFLVYGRMERGGGELLDFHILPQGSLPRGEYTVLYRYGRSHFEPFRHRDLRSLVGLTSVVPLEVAAAHHAGRRR
jgi:DNA invertase Pin-like site-specific DNA recombinase